MKKIILFSTALIIVNPAVSSAQEYQHDAQVYQQKSAPQNYNAQVYQNRSGTSQHNAQVYQQQSQGLQQNAQTYEQRQIPKSLQPQASAPVTTVKNPDNTAKSVNIYPTTDITQPITPTNSDLKDDKGVFTFSLENDFFAGTDSNYTNGFRASYMSPQTVPNWLENTANLLPLINTEGKKRWGVEFGQSMFTPNDISLTNPPMNDRPYAGFLYGAAKLVSDNNDTLDTFVLTLGMVGPASLAKETQTIVHDAIDYQEPRGWDTQLHDEPGIIVSYDKKFRNLYEFSPFGLGFDLTPSVGTNLGNVYTDANVGLMARLGRDLPSDYGPPLIRPSISGSDFFSPSKEFGWYLFSGVEGKAVARNIFLDGNTFRDSRSVDKEILVGGLQSGIAFTYGNTRVSYTQVMRTEEYDGEDKTQYGAINVSYRF